MRPSIHSALFIAVAISAAFVAGATQASTITVDIIGFEQGTNPADGQQFQTSAVAGPDDLFSINVGPMPAGAVWQLESLTANGDIDPFTTLGFTLTNTSGAVADFVMTILVPISPSLPAPTFIGGSTSFTVTNSDASVDDAVLASNGAGDPLFTALIDGAPVQTLFDAPFSLTASGTNDVSANFGPAIAGAAATSIAIEVNFSLSPGDSVSSTSVFAVVVPEPTSLATLCTAAGALLAWRRR